MPRNARKFHKACQDSARSRRLHEAIRRSTSGSITDLKPDDPCVTHNAVPPTQGHEIAGIEIKSR